MPSRHSQTESHQLTCLGVRECYVENDYISSTVFDAGVYSFDFGSMSNLALQGIIDSVVPAVDLVDGTLYSFTF